MSKASLKAFETLLKDEKRTNQSKEILEAVKKEPTTLERLWFTFNHLRQSTISARISELHGYGMVSFILEPTGGQSWIKYVSDEKEREAIRRSVQVEKRVQWLRKGISEGYLTEKFGVIELANEIISV